jgi:membrane protease YdiL (CAAX protease family)
VKRAVFGNRGRLIPERHPLLFVLVLLLVWVVPDWTLSGNAAGSLRLAALRQAVLLLLAAGLLTWLGWWNEAGFNGPGQWRHLRVALIPLFGVALFLRTADLPAGGTLALYGGLTLLIAMQEEAWHRGILLRTLVGSFGRRRAAALSAVLYGAVHAVYIFQEAPAITLIRAFGAGLCGFILAALRLRTRTIWPGVLISWLFYAGALLGQRLPRGDGLLPDSAERLAVQALLVVVIFGCAHLWMRAVPEVRQEEEQAGARVS